MDVAGARTPNCCLADEKRGALADEKRGVLADEKRGVLADEREGCWLTKRGMQTLIVA